MYTDTHTHVHTNKRLLYSKKIFSNTTINYIKFKLKIKLETAELVKQMEIKK